MTSTDPNYPAGVQYGLQGGFLVQSNGALSGQALYSIALDQAVNGQIVCDSGSAGITGTVNGSTLTLTAVTGTQTFQLTGTLSASNSSTGSGSSTTSPPTITGQFTTAGGTVTIDGASTVCGAAVPQSAAGSWSAVSVPPLTGSISGTFHSDSLGLVNQDFQLTGSLLQGPNIGASSATVTGTLNFFNEVTQLTDYPCITSGYVNVTGQISGNTVVLQLFGTNGSQVGQIGVPAYQALASNAYAQVTFDPVTPTGSYVLHSVGQSGQGQSYQVSTKTCNDSGYICIALNNATPCQQPITLTPSELIFSPQLLVCTSATCSPTGPGTASSQTITLTNNQPAGSAALTGLVLQLAAEQQTDFSDFTGIPDFSESDNCSSFLASSTPGQSCTITITFSPQESCNWMPLPPPSSGPPISNIAGNCPLTLDALLTIQSPVTNDNDTSFSVPATGVGLSYLQPSVAQVDFGAEALGESSPSQVVSFTNQSAYPVQIVGPASAPCAPQNPKDPAIHLKPPISNNGTYPGLAVIASYVQTLEGTPPAPVYACDADPTTGAPNFVLSSDTCTGALILPQQSCSVEITFVPQPDYVSQGGAGWDDFLELNSLQCTNSSSGPVSSDCELDSGRYAVELVADPVSPIRLLPGAGLDFGGVSSGKTSAAQDITLYNDPNDPNAATVNFLGKFTVSGSYVETDNCPLTLPSGSSCTLSIVFKPTSKGFNSGWIGALYTLGTSTAATNPQYIFLRGTGQ